MRTIPVIRCTDVKRSLAFYTGVLDFKKKYPEARVKDVDGLFRKYVERGLDTTGHEDSPVHRGPVNQTWGIREFYVTDADGNTLRFGEPLP